MVEQQSWDATSDALTLLSQRWVLYAVYGLMGGPKGFNELGRDCGGASGKVLASKLNAMEQMGIVERQVLSQIPPRTRYSLTPSGQDLRGIIHAVNAWAEHQFKVALDWQPAGASDADDDAEHPIRILQEKWILHIVRELLRGERSFNELSRAVGVNVTTLGQRLTRLRDWGLVEMTIGDGVLPRHSYRLTSPGQALRDVIDQTEKWAITHLTDESRSKRRA